MPLFSGRTASLLAATTAAPADMKGRLQIDNCSKDHQTAPQTFLDFCGLWKTSEKVKWDRYHSRVGRGCMVTVDAILKPVNFRCHASSLFSLWLLKCTPEEMPTSRPSSSARRRAISKASSLETWHQKTESQPFLLDSVGVGLVASLLFAPPGTTYLQVGSHIIARAVLPNVF